MSLPNYLAKIKSSGIYRFVWDKSQVPEQVAETLRLVVGYSEKGPFNTPVYIDNKPDFINIYGNVNKRLEKKGVFFHRMVLQALSAGPILALNLKPFKEESVEYVSMDPSKMAVLSDKYVDISSFKASNKKVTDIYNRNRFWELDPNNLINEGSQYINLSATDNKKASCTIFVRPANPESLKQYDVTVGEWYNEVVHDDVPEYLVGMENTAKIKDFFAEVFVFKGEFTKELCSNKGPLNKYFKTVDGKICLNDEYKNIFGEYVDALEALSQDSNSKFINSYKGCLLPSFKDANNNYISLDLLFNSDISSHKMMMKLNEDDLTSENIASLKFGFDYWTTMANVIPSKTAESGSKKTVAADPISAFPGRCLVPLYVKGYDYVLDKTGVDLQKSVLSVLDEKGIYTALTNRVDLEYHYIVDTFVSYSQYILSKFKLSAIAKQKDNAFAIINWPAMKDFLDNKEDIESIGKKSNILLPTEYEGASWAAFYTPLVFSDGTIKTTVPSAALVSNNFMEKYTSRQPYYIVAGPTYGKMSYSGLVGPDYNYGRSDLDVLEPMGVNAMVYVPRKGTFINSNQTAKQTPISALSKVHIRELIIFLQDEIENMLQNYQWELNTSVLRDTIKSKADTICEKCFNNGGIYDYLNVCDETNNTPEVIDNEMIILDTAIEPARGAGKMVQQLTIHRTGGISSITK